MPGVDSAIYRCIPPGDSAMELVMISFRPNEFYQSLHLLSARSIDNKLYPINMDGSLEKDYVLTPIS